MTALTRDEFVADALAKYESSLIGYAAGIVRDQERARDVVQDTFIRLYKQDIEKVRKGLKTWLYTVCRNRALDVLRKEGRAIVTDEEGFARCEAEGLSPRALTDWDERFRMVLDCLDKLSDNQQEVLRLKFQQGMSYKEISAVTGLTTGNVGFLIHTGLKRMRSLLPDDLLESI
ncbi:RNA polymerase sigma factor [Roseibacillus ishigakijimensis]|uniref:Sigma-70 family RNA polymerase sigma factor n=1 Tax=Roseibacillus ishigakijimensis TaxID=454146 RepID=A0A934VP02_9BACT|nr:sigma-70 family RNA polymerase sigma factor [Roseibacillus ishigakijimensis]MBK1835580.1 sigma-70 family RNA polymerase sigma factor [Roseibacillus ishigakijimensis]